MSAAAQVKADTYPRKVWMERQPYGGCWVVVGWYRHFWPNGDSCTVHIAAGDTRRSAVWRALREIRR